MRTGLKLRHIGVVSFRKNVVTNLEETLKYNRIHLNTNEAVAFISVRGDQVLMALVLEVRKGQRAFHHQGFRLEGGSWDYKSLMDCARKFGVDLGWIRRKLEVYFNSLGVFAQ